MELLRLLFFNHLRIIPGLKLHLVPKDTLPKVWLRSPPSFFVSQNHSESGRYKQFQRQPFSTSRTFCQLSCIFSDHYLRQSMQIGPSWFNLYTLSIWKHISPYSKQFQPLCQCQIIYMEVENEFLLITFSWMHTLDWPNIARTTANRNSSVWNEFMSSLEHVKYLTEDIFLLYFCPCAFDISEFTLSCEN